MEISEIILHTDFLSMVLTIVSQHHYDVIYLYFANAQYKVTNMQFIFK